MGDNSNGPTNFRECMDTIRQLWLSFPESSYERCKSAGLAAGANVIGQDVVNWLQNKTVSNHVFRYMGFMTSLSPDIDYSIRDTRCWEFFCVVTDIHIPLQTLAFINKKANIQTFLGNSPLLLPKKFFQQVVKVPVFQNKNHLLYLFSIIWKIRLQRMDPVHQNSGNQYYFILERDWGKLIKGVGYVCELWDKLSQDLCDDSLFFHDWAFSEDFLFFCIDDLQYKQVPTGQLPHADVEITINEDNLLVNNPNATPLTDSQAKLFQLLGTYESSIDTIAEHWRSLFNSSKVGEDITVPTRFQDIIDDARRHYQGVPGQQHLPNVDLSTLNVTNAHPSSQLASPEPANVNYVGPPEDYPAMSRFPVELQHYIAAMMGVPVHDVMELMSKPVSEWPTDMYLKFVKYGTHYDGLLFEACVKTRTFIDTSTIPNSGKGLFATEGFVEHELICYFYGHLVYNPGTHANSNVSTIRFGKRGMYTTVQDMMTNGFKLSDERQDDFYSNDDRDLHEIMVVPFKSCPALYINDHRILGADGKITDQEHFAQNAEFKVRLNRTRDNLKEPLTVGIFAIKDIEPNEEIFVNYGDGYTTNVGDGKQLLVNHANKTSDKRRRSNRKQGKQPQGSSKRQTRVKQKTNSSKSSTSTTAHNPSFWSGESLLEKWTANNRGNNAGGSSSNRPKNSRISTRNRN